MKRSILFIATVLFLCIGNQSATAQAKMKKDVEVSSTEQLEAAAMKKTSELVRPLGLTKAQQKQVFSLFVEVENKMSKSKVEGDNEKKKTLQNEIDNYVQVSIKKILKEEQYKKYLELTKRF